MAILSACILVYAYRKNKYDQYLHLATGFVLAAVWLVILIPLNTLGTRSINNELLNIIVGIGMISASFFVGLFFVSMKGLKGEKLSRRDNLALSYLAFVTGIDVMALRVADDYGVSYDPPWALSVYATGVVLILIMTITLISDETQQKMREEMGRKKGSKLMMLGLLLLSGGIIAAVFERLQSTSTYGYFIFINVGLLLITTAIVRDPHGALVSPSFGKYVVLSEKSTGAFIFERAFDNTIDVSLFSAGMRAVIDVMDELLGEFPRTIAFLDGSMVISESENYVLYLICNTQTPQIVRNSEEFLRKVEEYNWRGGIIDDDFIRYMDTTLEAVINK